MADIHDYASSLETVRRSDGNETIRRREPVPAPEEKAAPAVRAPEYFIGADGGRLKVIRPMAPGGEGELYLCRAGAEEVVVKVLNYDSDLEIIEGLAARNLEPSHLMPLLHVGAMSDAPGREYDRRSYTVSPFYERGDLSVLDNARVINPSITYDGESFSGSNSDYARVRCDYGAVDEKAFEKLLGQLHAALRTLHSSELLPETGGVIHRDIRPQNILQDEDGEYYLGDFGLVSALERGAQVKFTERFGVSHGYSPPEAYSDRIFKQSVTRKYDYFSLGMTLLHIVGGRPLYLIGADPDRLEPYETSLFDFYEIITLSNVALPAALPPRIANLLRGLLTVSVEDRFGADEVEAWLAGGNPVAHELVEELQSGIEIRINRKDYRGEREVALAIVENWDLFLKLTASGELGFEWRSADVAYRQRVREAVEAGRGLPPEQALIGITRAVWPRIGHVFRGRRYPTDRELGEAMLRASADELEVFASHLRSGGLSALKKAGGDSRGLDVLLEVERLASSKPGAAVRIAGAYLSGQPLPPVSTPEGDFADLRELADFVRQELGSVMVAYLQRTGYRLPEISPVPGVYASDDRSQLAVVQFDGSVIGDANSFQETPVLNARLIRLMDWALPSGNLRSAADVNEELYARLILAGAVRFQEGAAPQEPGEDRWSVFLRFLSLFPEFRLHHGADELFDRFFERARKLLDRVASVRLPRVEGGRTGGPATIDAAKRRAAAAIRRFEEDRSFENLYMAFLETLDGLDEIRQLAHANKAAAFHVVTVFESVFGSGSIQLRKDYDAVMAEYRGTLSGTPRLMEFMERLQKLDERAAAEKKGDFAPYYLSEEAETVRRLAKDGGGRLDYVLPDTTDAKESYAYLQNWLRSRKR